MTSRCVILGVPKKHREHREAPRAPCVVKGRSLFPGRKRRCHGALSLNEKALCVVKNEKAPCEIAKRKSTVCSSSVWMILHIDIVDAGILTDGSNPLFSHP